MPSPKPQKSVPENPHGAKVATEQPNAPLEAVGPVVQWARIAKVQTDLARATQGDPAAWSAFARLTAGLVEPVRLLEELADLATPALAGQAHSRERFAAHLRFVGQAIGVVRPRTQPVSREFASSPNDCCCGTAPEEAQLPRRPTMHHDWIEVPAHPATPATADDASAPTQPPQSCGIFHESALSTLLVAAAAAAMDASPASDLSLEEATDTITTLALDACLLAGFVRAHDRAGLEGLLGALESARTAGKLAWLSTLPPIGLGGNGDSGGPPGMSTMSGGAPGGFDMPNLPKLPQLPGLPHVPGHPAIPGIPTDPEIPGTLEDIIAALFKGIRKPKVWDPEKHDHAYPFWREPPTLHDPFDLYDLRCSLQVIALLKARKEPPPASPPQAVWNTGITSITLEDPCAGAKIVVSGRGFGATQPANTSLLLPTLDGCRAVAPDSWSNTRIEAVLPVRVSSGPVGFGDTAYIAAYDAWAARMNDLERQMARLTCRPRPIALVAPFGRCPPSSPINRITAGTPEIVAFTANDETVHVLAPGQPLTLRWTIRNAGTVRIERTSPSGVPFGGSTTFVPSVLQNAYAFGPVNHVAIGEWTYRITLTGACGGAISRTVTVVCAKHPALKVAQIQVTQSIQTPDHAVKLVAFKPTVLRVLVKHGLGTWGGGAVPSVFGRLRMYRAPNWSPWIDAANNTAPMQATPGTAITVPVLPTMNNTNDTLNFVLPADWSWGTVKYEVELRVTGFGATPQFAGYSDRASGQSPVVNYENRRTLQLRYIRVNWNGMGAPSNAVCQDTLAAAVPLLPTPSAGIAPVPGQGVHSRSSSVAQERTRCRDMLDDFEDEHNCSAWEAASEWLGADCPDDDGAIWVLIPGDFRRGEAFATPSNVCYTPPSNGPYAAHELAHCLNQQHVRLPATGANAPEGGDAASAWPNSAMLTDVPFDTRGNTSGTANPPRALSLSGKGVADVMTYWGTPNNTWPMPRRWQQLWDYIGP